MRLRTVLLVLAILLLSSFPATADDIPVDQASLTSGAVYEINIDAAGQKLYVTDWGAGKIWRVDPASSVYSRFEGLGAPNDARPDSAGNIWFTDYYSPLLRRIGAGTNPTLTTWDLSAWDPARTFGLGGLAIDGNGWVWFTEQGESDTQLLYRFKPDTKQLCGYTLPGGDHSFYVLYHGGYLWLGDWMQNRIVRFDPANLQYSYWDATAVGEPRGLAVDGSGFIWWADRASGKIVRLEPGGSNANRLTSYTLPVSGMPYMVAIQGSKVWYTAEGVETSTVGILDPDAAANKTSSKNPVTGASTTAPYCDNSLGEGASVSIGPLSGSLNWSARVWTDVTPAGAAGWTVYETAYGGVPYGILAQTDRVWVTDQLYQQLVRITQGLTAPFIAIRIPSSTTDVELSWNAVPGATLYRVWWSDGSPYFLPNGTPAQENGSTTFTHAGAASAAHSYFYLVRAANGSGAESVDSNRTGVFSFDLTKGTN